MWYTGIVVYELNEYEVAKISSWEMGKRCVFTSDRKLTAASEPSDSLEYLAAKLTSCMLT